MVPIVFYGSRLFARDSALFGQWPFGVLFFAVSLNTVATL